jgi:hypothetical protein
MCDHHGDYQTKKSTVTEKRIFVRPNWKPLFTVVCFALGGCSIFTAPTSKTEKIDNIARFAIRKPENSSQNASGNLNLDTFDLFSRFIEKNERFRLSLLTSSLDTLSPTQLSESELTKMLIRAGYTSDFGDQTQVQTNRSDRQKKIDDLRSLTFIWTLIDFHLAYMVDRSELSDELKSSDRRTRVRHNLYADFLHTFHRNAELESLSQVIERHQNRIKFNKSTLRLLVAQKTIPSDRALKSLKGLEQAEAIAEEVNAEIRFAAEESFQITGTLEGTNKPSLNAQSKKRLANADITDFLKFAYRTRAEATVHSNVSGQDNKKKAALISQNFSDLVALRKQILDSFTSTLLAFPKRKTEPDYPAFYAAKVKPLISSQLKTAIILYSLAFSEYESILEQINDLAVPRDIIRVNNLISLENETAQISLASTSIQLTLQLKKIKALQALAQMRLYQSLGVPVVTAELERKTGKLSNQLRQRAAIFESIGFDLARLNKPEVWPKTVQLDVLVSDASRVNKKEIEQLLSNNLKERGFAVVGISGEKKLEVNIEQTTLGDEQFKVTWSFAGRTSSGLYLRLASLSLFFPKRVDTNSADVYTKVVDAAWPALEEWIQNQLI